MSICTNVRCAHLKRGEHSSSSFRNNHLRAQLMEFLPERLRLQSGASTEQRRMERSFRVRFFNGGPAVFARMMITVMTIVIVTIVARFHRSRSRGNRIRRMNRQNGLHRMTGTARSLYSSGALQTGCEKSIKDTIQRID